MFGPDDDEAQFWHESTNGFMIMILPIFKRDIAYRMMIDALFCCWDPVSHKTVVR
jgi:hypothetical protein